jgi:hypothetical protein
LKSNKIRERGGHLVAAEKNKKGIIDTATSLIINRGGENQRKVTKENKIEVYQTCGKRLVVKD